MVALLVLTAASITICGAVATHKDNADPKR